MAENNPDAYYKQGRGTTSGEGLAVVPEYRERKSQALGREALKLEEQKMAMGQQAAAAKAVAKAKTDRAAQMAEINKTQFTDPELSAAKASMMGELEGVLANYDETDPTMVADVQAKISGIQQFNARYKADDVAFRNAMALEDPNDMRTFSDTVKYARGQGPKTEVTDYSEGAFNMNDPRAVRHLGNLSEKSSYSGEYNEAINFNKEGAAILKEGKDILANTGGLVTEKTLKNNGTHMTEEEVLTKNKQRLREVVGNNQKLHAQYKNTKPSEKVQVPKLDENKQRQYKKDKEGVERLVTRPATWPEVIDRLIPEGKRTETDLQEKEESESDKKKRRGLKLKEHVQKIQNGDQSAAESLKGKKFQGGTISGVRYNEAGNLEIMVADVGKTDPLNPRKSLIQRDKPVVIDLKIDDGASGFQQLVPLFRSDYKVGQTDVDESEDPEREESRFSDKDNELLDKDIGLLNGADGKGGYHDDADKHYQNIIELGFTQDEIKTENNAAGKFPLEVKINGNWCALPKRTDTDAERAAKDRKIKKNMLEQERKSERNKYNNDNRSPSLESVSDTETDTFFKF